MSKVGDSSIHGEVNFELFDVYWCETEKLKTNYLISDFLLQHIVSRKNDFSYAAWKQWVQCAIKFLNGCCCKFIMHLWWQIFKRILLKRGCNERNCYWSQWPFYKYVNGEKVKFQRNAQTQIVSRRIRTVARF